MKTRSATNSGIVMVLMSDPYLTESVDRVAAAAGVRVVRTQSPNRKTWSSAAAVVLDPESAEQCLRAALPRRDAVVLLASGDPSPSTWSAAVAIGAQHVCPLPAQEAQLARVLADAVELGRGAHRNGRMIAVTAGRGGAGASVFAAALAKTAGDALLVDLDECGGGVDLLLGCESTPGLRWPDLSLRGGRLNWSAVREALPRRDGVTVLSSARTYCDIDAAAVCAVVDAGRRGGSTVVCDVPRQLNRCAADVLESADLVVVVTSCDVRALAATAALAGLMRGLNPYLGLVVRGPSPGGLLAREAADVVAAPLLAAMRPQPMLAQQIERGGLRVGRRSPLGVAARAVVDVVDQRSGAMAA